MFQHPHHFNINSVTCKRLKCIHPFICDWCNIKNSLMRYGHNLKLSLGCCYKVNRTHKNQPCINQNYLHCYLVNSSKFVNPQDITNILCKMFVLYVMCTFVYLSTCMSVSQVINNKTCETYHNNQFNKFYSLSCLYDICISCSHYRLFLQSEPESKSIAV